jgi:hypothetical protein
MATLRELLYGYGEGDVITPGDFSVWNTNITSVSNGGQCCLWTVPAGVSTATFEIWSGGGGGGMACCCQQGGGAGSGGYAIKTCTVTPGEQFRICAAGSTCCDSGNLAGHVGSCSFVCSLSGGAASPWEAKVCGGYCVGGSCNRCYYFINCYTCCTMCYCCLGTSVNTDFCIPGTMGNAQPTQFCYGEGHQYAAGAPMTGHGIRYGGNGCCQCFGGDRAFGLFPGGGGLSALVHGNCCQWGGPGAGGLIYVLYY